MTVTPENPLGLDGFEFVEFTSPDPARYLAIAFGGLRYPMTEAKRRVFMGMDVNVRDGGAQIEYEDQEPRIHKIYLDELAKNGAQSTMGAFIDETPYQGAPAKALVTAK